MAIRKIAKGKVGVEMKKLIRFIMPVKTLAAMIFAGLMCAYVVAGALFGLIVYPGFEYTVPFIFVIQGVVMSIVIAVLWEYLLGGYWFKKMRYFPRLIIFAASMTILLSLGLLTFIPWHTNEAKLWLIVAGFVIAAIGVLSIIGEVYYRVTGKRYTKILENYKVNMFQQ